MKKHSGKVIAMLMTALTLCCAAAPMASAAGEPAAYPYVFVHGFGGWGTDKWTVAPYFGGTSCNLLKELGKLGYECCAPSYGPYSSAWDVACELYAKLTGTRVDYGAAHAEKYGHERYGETYTKPLISGWGSKDEHGRVKKVNFICHSFGGAAVRVLTELLARGSKEERLASPGDYSELFDGGRTDWVFSITALASPHNGTTFLYTLGDVTKLSRTQDNAIRDLSLEGADELNRKIKINPDVYYFSYPFDGTKDSARTGGRSGTRDMIFYIQPLATLIGSYKTNRVNDYAIDRDWLPNDGLVNTISATAPFNEPSKDFTGGNIEKGIWHVMPVTRGDHSTAVGMFKTMEWTLGFYTEQMERINSLTARSTVDNA